LTAPIPRIDTPGIFRGGSDR